MKKTVGDLLNKSKKEWITSADASHKPIILYGSHFVLCYPNRVACLVSVS